MVREFSAAAVVEITGVSQRSLDYWDKTDFVKPSGKSRREGRKNARGKGRLYSYDDLIRIGTVVRLREAGIDLKRIRDARKRLFRRDRERDLLLQTVATNGKSLEWKRGDGTIVDLAKGGQMVFSVLSLHQVEAEMARVIARLDAEKNKSAVDKGSRRKRSAS